MLRIVRLAVAISFVATVAFVPPASASSADGCLSLGVSGSGSTCSSVGSGPAGATTGAGTRAALAMPATEAGRDSLAELGFRPQLNGFSFENYGAGATNLTADSMQMLFGAGVCATGTGAACLLSPQAKTWMDNNNKEMTGGHCFGFSAMSLLLFGGKLSPATFGGATTFAVTRSAQVESYIAYAFTFQGLDAINQARVEGTPNDIVAKLTDVFQSKTELYNMAIFKRDNTGGHAITPFAIERQPDGKTAILVYDNNFPGETRKVLVDPAANTWQYQASQNPSEPAELYEGDANTRTLSLVPTYPGLGVQTCPFCGPAPDASGPGVGTSTLQAAARGYDSYFLTGDPTNHPTLLIIDSLGRKLGWVGKRFYQQVPGARAIWPTLGVPVWRLREQPELRVPSGQDLRIIVDGSSLTKATTAGLAFVTRGRDAGIQGIRLTPGQKATVRISGHGTVISFRREGNQVQKPAFQIGFQGPTTSRAFTIKTHSLSAGSEVTFAIDDSTGTLAIHGAGLQGDGLEYDLRMETIDDSGLTTFEADNQDVASGDEAMIDYGNWTDGSEAPPTDQGPDLGGPDI